MTKFFKILLVMALFEVVFVRGTEPFTRFFWGLGFPKAILGMSTYGFIAAALMLIVSFLFRFSVRRPFSQYGFSKTSAEAWTLGLASLGFLFPIAFLGRIADPGFDGLYARYAGLLTMNGVGVFMLTLPFFLFREELFLRFMQAETSRAIGRWSAIFLLAVNFALLHYPFAFPRHAAAVLVSVFFGSVVLNVLFARTQNIWITLVVHTLYDLVITLQIYFHASGQTLAEWILWTLYGIFFLLCLRRGLSLFQLGRSEEKNTERSAPAVLLFGTAIVGLTILLLFVF